MLSTLLMALSFRPPLITSLPAEKYKDKKIDVGEQGGQPIIIMCLTFLVTENLGGKEGKSELAHIVGELEDPRPIHSPSISLGENSNKELTHAVGEQEDQIIHSSHSLGEKDERELTHIVGE